MTAGARIDDSGKVPGNGKRYSRARSMASPETVASRAPTRSFPRKPMHRWKVGWESARKAGGVSCRFHDLRHTFISRLAESQASDSTVMALAGHVSGAMMERYSHIRMEAKRHAVDNLSGTDFEPGVAQNWAQFFVSVKSEEAKRTYTYHQSQATY